MVLFHCVFARERTLRLSDSAQKNIEVVYSHIIMCELMIWVSGCARAVWTKQFLTRLILPELSHGHDHHVAQLIHTDDVWCLGQRVVLWKARLRDRRLNRFAHGVEMHPASSHGSVPSSSLSRQECDWRLRACGEDPESERKWPWQKWHLIAGGDDYMANHFHRPFKG
jgi:hypothetical protein